MYIHRHNKTDKPRESYGIIPVYKKLSLARVALMDFPDYYAQKIELTNPTNE